MVRHTLRASASLLVLGLAAPAFAGVGAQPPLPPSYVPDLEPPNPVAGECYARVEIPARYEPVTHRVLTRDGYQTHRVEQAALQSSVARIQTREGSVRYEVRQPTYGTVVQKVQVRPAYEKITVTEPRFAPVTETVEQGRPRLVWKRGNPVALRAQGYVIHSVADGGPGGRGYGSTVQYGATGGSQCGASCDIWCLVEEPGDAVTVTRHRLVEPGRVHRTPVPAEYRAVERTVVTDPGGVREIPVPAEYSDIHIQTLLRPGQVASHAVAPEYGHAQGRRLVSESRYEWRRVVCQPDHAAVPYQPHSGGHHPAVPAHPVSYAPAGLAGGSHTAHRTAPRIPGDPLPADWVPVLSPVPDSYPDRFYSGPAYNR